MRDPVPAAQPLASLWQLTTLILIWLGLALPAAAAASDTTPPGSPSGLVVSQGDGWQPDSHFDLHWDNPVGQDSPIAVAHYELCPAMPVGPCFSQQTAEIGISTAGIDLPYSGWFWLRLWLEDAAGNADPSARSLAVMLRFDGEVPPPGSLQADGGWVNSSMPEELSYSIAIGPGMEWPLSGIGGYSVTIDGSDPDGTIDTFAGQDYERFPAEYSIDVEESGITSIRIRSVSNAGVGSNEIVTALVRIDRDPPAVLTGGLPVSDKWWTSPVIATLSAIDQPSLSGMVPAPVDHAVEEGAYLAYRLDGADEQKVRGGEADVVVGADGRHTLSFEAFDAAGNPSGERSVELKIDRTAPVGAFAALDPQDPRRLTVNVSDATSGMASGRIEHRRVGERGFTPLPTTLADGHLTARIDDASMPAGRYEFRAVARDVAGNETTIDGRADEGVMALMLPVRGGVKIGIAARESVRSCVVVRPPPRRGHRRAIRARASKRRCRLETRTRVAGAPFRVGYGAGLASTGTARTSQGRAMSGIEVVAEAQPRSGGPFARIGAARSDEHGAFRLTIPPGPSRTIRYRFAGSDTLLPASAQLVTRVPAAARLTVDRHRLVNGQSVRFAGRLLGRPIPADGKLVALQAKVGRRWRTFATPRANASGAFGYRYRFTATTGLRRYFFRARVTREAAYPYEGGLSRAVKVVVRGRR